ncbi:Uncharacterised protein [Mycobacteroides abscessus subsp. abscessus]|nr:Uncharacterised protein [Mycobacteroides abscessus subsp. abscessus]
MESTRYLISATAEFTSGVKNCEDCFNCRTTCFFLDINRDTTPIVNNCNRIIWLNKNFDMTSESRQSFVDRIIYNFPD